MGRKYLYLVLPVIILLTIIGWQVWRSNPRTPPVTARVVGSYITVGSIEDLVRQSEVIAVGTVVKVADKHFNTARNPLDHSQPASDLTIVGTIYEVQVEQYLKSDGDSPLRIVQSEDIVLSSALSEGEEVTVQVSDGFTPLTVGGRYIFFLRLSEPYPDAPFSELYHGVAEPWRFRLEHGRAFAESPWQMAGKVFPPMGESDLLQQVTSEATK